MAVDGGDRAACHLLRVQAVVFVRADALDQAVACGRIAPVDGHLLAPAGSHWDGTGRRGVKASRHLAADSGLVLLPWTERPRSAPLAAGSSPMFLMWTDCLAGATQGERD